MNKFILSLALSLVWASASFGQGGMMPGPGTVHSVAASLALDGVSNVKIALSTRKLRTAYAGSALRAQRLSDNATQDIGFSSNVLDTASLATFCSGTTCLVNIWYDQSTSATNCAPFFLQLTEAPIIYSGGAVRVINSTRPAAFWNSGGSPATRLICTGVNTNPVNTLYTSTVANLTAKTNNVLSGADNSSGWVFAIDGTVNTTLVQALASSTTIGSSTNPVTNGTAGVYEASYESVGGAWAIWIDAAASGSGSNPQTLTTRELDLGTAIGGGFGYGTDGLQGEFIQIDQVGSFSGRATLQANQKAYWGTP